MAHVYKIGEAAARIGLTHRALRYYEELGLLENRQRNAGETRRYSDEDLINIERIIELRDLLGFSLIEIKRIIESDRKIEKLKTEYFSDKGDKKAILTEASDLISGQLKLIEKKVIKLRNMKHSLNVRLNRIEEELQALE